MKRFLSLVVIGILVFSMTGAAPAVAEEEYDQLVLIRDVGETEDISALKEVGDVLDRYGRYVLLETSDCEIEKLEYNYDIDMLENRNQLNIKGHEFDTNHGYPDLDPELMIGEYESGTEGLYIVDMIGPVNPEWRRELEELGVEVINYQRSYAYEIKMTSELVEDVEDLFFVDWVGIYQPGFKLAEDIEEGEISIRLVENACEETIKDIEELVDVKSVTELTLGGIKITAELEDTSKLSEIARLREVYYISNTSEIKLEGEMSTQITGGGLWFWDPEDNLDSPWRGEGVPEDELEPPYGGDAGSLATQLGYTGDGVTIAVADTGICPDHDDFQERVIGGVKGEEHDDGPVVWVEEDWEDTKGHGTQVAGVAAGDTFNNGTNETTVNDYYAAQGTAPKTELFAMKISGDGAGVPEDEWRILYAANDYSDGKTYIHTNSWGGGNYLEGYDKGVRNSDFTDENEPMIITASVGNDGESISSPGKEKNIIGVGSTENYYLEGEPIGCPEAIALDSSGKGWTTDNRVKPDLVAPGAGVNTTSLDGEYEEVNGSSYASPNVAGSAAVVVQWYEDTYNYTPSPAMVKALLINTAESLESDQTDDGDIDHIPNKFEGWGIVHLSNLVYEEETSNFILEDQNSTLQTAEENEYAVTYEDEDEPMKISLVWTDKEAKEGDEIALKNNLDLEVESPNGDVYRGNAFAEDGGEESTTGYTYANTDTMSVFDSSDDGWDDRNNVQNVYIHPDELEPGTYTVRIKGENIPSDGTNDGWSNQDYALVVQNGAQKTLHEEEENRDLLDEDYLETVEVLGEREYIQVKMDYQLFGGEDTATIRLYIDEDMVWSDAHAAPSKTEREMVRVFDVSSDDDQIEMKVTGYAYEDIAFVEMKEISVCSRRLFTYTLTLESSSGGTTDPSPGTYTLLEGETITITAQPYSGYDFANWEGDYPEGEKYSRTITIEMDEDKYLKAHFIYDEFN